MSYGSTPYHEQKSSFCEEKTSFKPESVKDTSSYQDSDKSSEETSNKLTGNGEKRTLAQVGKLPSYSTALKMPPYAPEKRLSDNSDVDIGYLKEDVKTPTLEKKRPGLRKNVTFDDSTGDVRLEFTAGDTDENLPKSIKPPSPSMSMAHHTRPFLGSPPYDNEPEFHSPLSKVLSTIPEAPSSPSDVSSVAATSTTWSHIHPKPQVPLLKIATSQVGDLSSAYSGTCQHQIVSTVDVTSAPSPITSPIVSAKDVSEIRGDSEDSLKQHQRQARESTTPFHSGVPLRISSHNEEDTPVTLRNPLTVQSSQDSSGSSKLSVYDNVNYSWKSKHGSELKHYHF